MHTDVSSSVAGTSHASPGMENSPGNGGGNKNFRAGLLHKVGMERESVNWKFALTEQILKEPVIDIKKLQKFALKYQVPPAHSLQVWKLLLGVSSPNSAAEELVSKQRSEQFYLLWRSLNIMRKSQFLAPPGTHLTSLRPQPKDFLKLYLLEEGKFGMDGNVSLLDPLFISFLTIAERMSELCPDDSTTYWLAKEAYRYIFGLSSFDDKGRIQRTTLPDRVIQKKLNDRRSQLDTLVQETKRLLRKTDSELCVHIDRYGIWKHIPLLSWYESGFAQIFASNPISKLWNTLFAGSFESMIYVAVELLHTIRKKIMLFDDHSLSSPRFASSNDFGSRDDDWCVLLTGYCAQLTEDSQGTVIYRGLDRWSRESGALFPKQSLASTYSHGSNSDQIVSPFEPSFNRNLKRGSVTRD